MKNNRTKRGKPPLGNPERNTLEKEIDELIDREKTRIRIVNKLLDQTVSATSKSVINGH